jgi:hypothetical protein
MARGELWITNSFGILSAAKFSKKIGNFFPKKVDNFQFLWYNIYVIKRGEQSNEERNSKSLEKDDPRRTTRTHTYEKAWVYPKEQKGLQQKKKA